MALGTITLTASMRSNVLALQNTQQLFQNTQTRLATGKKVNSALDDPIAYFPAKSYTDRANDLNSLKNDMNEAIQVVTAANNGVSAISDLIAQAKSIANSALATTDTTAKSNYATQFNTVLSQIDNVAFNAGYKGVNLVYGGSLTVYFSSTSTDYLKITGFTATSGTSGGGLSITTVTSAWTGTPLTELDTATTSLRTQSQSMAGNLAIVNTRLDFTSSMVNTLQKGADNLTLADMNEEGANLLMLQTRQALGTTALSLASQQAQAVLRLF